MNATQLRKIGIPQFCIPQAIKAIQLAAKERGTSEIKKDLKLVAESPQLFVGDATFGELARRFSMSGRSRLRNRFTTAPGEPRSTTVLTPK